MSAGSNVLEAIGNTSLVELRRVVPPACAKIFVKLEGQNPTGSMKDRMAQAMVAGAENDGRLRPGDTIVEYTGGSTGASLALVCAAKGYRLRIVTSDAFSEDKLTQMAALGAELTLVPSEGGLITKKLILNMIEAAREISRQPRTCWTDQLNNADSIAGYKSMGEEIWDQTNGKVDAFVQAVGTAASLRGVAAVLKRHYPAIEIVAVEPGESPVLSGGQAGPHKIEGIGIGGSGGGPLCGNVVRGERHCGDPSRRALGAGRWNSYPVGGLWSKVPSNRPVQTITRLTSPRRRQRPGSDSGAPRRRRDSRSGGTRSSRSDCSARCRACTGRGLRG